MLRSLQKTIGKWARPCLSHCYLGATSSTRCWCGIVTHGLLTSELGPVLRDWGGLSRQGPHAVQGGISLANAAPRLSYTARNRRAQRMARAECMEARGYTKIRLRHPGVTGTRQSEILFCISLSAAFVRTRCCGKTLRDLALPTSSSVVPRLALTCSLTCRTLTHTARGARMSPRIYPGRHPAMLAVGAEKSIRPIAVFSSYRYHL